MALSGLRGYTGRVGPEALAERPNALDGQPQAVSWARRRARVGETVNARTRAP